jgi:hypothetical protein
MKQMIALDDKKKTLEKHLNGKFNNVGSAGENKRKSLQQFLPLLEAQIWGLLQPAQASFFGWDQHNLKALFL